MGKFAQATGSNELQRTIEISRMSPGLSENLDRQGSLLIGVSGRRDQEGRASRSGERPQMEDLSCETCYQKLEPHQQLEQCSACGRWTHGQCQERLDIGKRWHVLMCLMCKNKEHWFRIQSRALVLNCSRFSEEQIQFLGRR